MIEIERSDFYYRQLFHFIFILA